MAATNTTPTLGMPIADGGIAAVNFFNGRLLTGMDLSREQDARRLSDQRVGQAVGPGVAWGLEVSVPDGSPTTQGQVRVSAGVGVTPSGQVLKLSADTVARLVPPASDIAAATAGEFGACAPLGAGTYVAGDGLYLLTLAPTLKADGTAPVLALESVNLRCSTDAWIESVQLRLLAVNGWEDVKDLAIPPTDPDQRSLAKFRNQLAHEFLASSSLAAAHARPGTAAVQGKLEAWLADGPSRCDLPLALVYMVGPEILFIESWAVRRRLAAAPASILWAPWIGQDVQALAEARLLQFQAQLSEQRATILAKAAQNSLQWLPPAGVLPPGTAWQTFLGGRATTPPMALAPGDASGLLAAALAGDAVNLADAGDKTRYLVYKVSGDGSVLFVRDARNVHAAEQVWVDGERAGLPNVADVQTAIDTLRAGNCLHVVLRPGMDSRQIAKLLPEKGDFVLCFEPGTYDKLDAPIAIEGRRSVAIHGSGAELVAIQNLTALRVVDCFEVSACGLSISGIYSADDGSVWNEDWPGALSVKDTEHVFLSGLQLSARFGLGGPDNLSYGALRLSATDVEPGGVKMRATVSDCRIEIGGTQQYGLLAFDPAHLEVRSCSFAGPARNETAGFGIGVVGSQLGRVKIVGNRFSRVGTGAYTGPVVIGNLRKATKEQAPVRPAEAVLMSDNVIELAHIPGVTKGPVSGLVVGDADSVRLVGNQVSISRTEGKRSGAAGIALSGTHGAQLLLRENRFVGTAVGVSFDMTVPNPDSVVLWLAVANLGEALAGPMFEMDDKLEAWIKLHDNVPAA